MAQMGKARLLLMLEAYCDESTDMKRERVFCMAGFLAPAEAWNCLWGQWDRVLHEETLTAFHMVDYETDPATSREEKDRLQRRFIDIITGTVPPLTGIISGVLLEPYQKRIAELKRLRKIPSGLAVSGSLEDPYFLVFQHVLEIAHKSIEHLPAEETVAFVFDRHHMRGRATAIHDSLVSDASYPHRSRAGGVQFNDRVRVKPLQAADFLAYESYRHACDVTLDAKAERWQFTELTRCVPDENAHLIREDGVDELIEMLERRRK
jgi:hypothetical protein